MQQNLNVIGTEYQRIYNSCLPLTDTNNYVLEAHIQKSIVKFKRLY